MHEKEKKKKKKKGKKGNSRYWDLIDIKWNTQVSAIHNIEPRHEKTCFCHMRTTKVQIIVRCLDSITPLLAIAEISRPYLVSVIEQAGSSLTWSKTPKLGFLVSRLICMLI